MLGRCSPYWDLLSISVVSNHQINDLLYGEVLNSGKELTLGMVSLLVCLVCTSVLGRVSTRCASVIMTVKEVLTVDTSWSES